MAQVIHKTAARDMLTDMIALGGPLEMVVVRLYKDVIAPTPDTPLTAFEAAEANFDGYAPSPTVVWGAVQTDFNGGAVVAGKSHQFTCTGPTNQNTVHGYFLVSGVAPATKLIASERLPQPLPVADLGDAIVIVPKFGIPGPVASYAEAL